MTAAAARPRREPAPPSTEFYCAGCGDRIRAGGVLAADGFEVAAHEQYLADRARNQPRPGVIPEPIDLLELPRLVPWLAFHDGCLTRSVGYEVPLSELTTWYGVTDWTSHLMTKGWITSTDWFDVVRRLLRRQPGGRQLNQGGR